MFMILRVWRHLCLWLAAVMVAASPASLSAQAPQRIVAVGDLHGDYGAWIDIARSAGFVDGKLHWAGGRTTLVQAGDIVDRGPDSLKIIRHLRKLEKEAARAGGRVIALVGNHEAMNMTGDLRYTDPGEYAAFTDVHSEALRQAAWDANGKSFTANYKTRHPELSDKQIRDAWFTSMPLGMLEHQRAWAPDGELGRWVAGNPAVVRLGDSLFVHGGISAAFANIPVAEINRRVSAALKAREIAQASIINDPLGPLWYRGLITRGALDQEGWSVAIASNPALAATPRPGIDAELDMVLKGFGVKRVVIAHTPNLAGIDISHGGKLVRIDTGNSRYYKGQLSWLEINGDQVTPHVVARGTR
jgi:hypothetical protein